MEFSKIQRLMLVNQYKILERLYPEDADYYSEHRKALEYGYTLHYNWIFEGLYDELSKDKCQEVIDILNMHRALLGSYNRLDDKTGITLDDIKFKGFDGNNESKQLLYAKYFMHDLKRFDELHDDSPFPDYNSHYPMLDHYRRMLQLWNAIDKKHYLSKQDILKIIGSK